MMWPEMKELRFQPDANDKVLLRDLASICRIGASYETAMNALLSRSTGLDVLRFSVKTQERHD